VIDRLLESCLGCMERCMIGLRRCYFVILIELKIKIMRHDECASGQLF